MFDQITDLLKWILVPVIVLGAMALFWKLFPMKRAETVVREPSIGRSPWLERWPALGRC